MKELDLATLRITRPLDESRLEEARSVLRDYDALLKHPDITGSALGVSEEAPYIQLYVKPGKGRELEKQIPDKLGNLDVFYIETKFKALD